MAMVAASLLFGYLAIPYITVYPTRWAVDRLAQANAGEFALGVIAIVIGLLMGVLVGVPLSSLGGAVGPLLPAVVAVILALVMLWATLYKRDVLVPALAGVLPGARSPIRPAGGGDRHQRGDRRADRGHRADRLHPGHAGGAALRARRAAADRRLAGRRCAATVAGAGWRCWPPSSATRSARWR